MEFNLAEYDRIHRYKYEQIFMFEIHLYQLSLKSEEQKSNKKRSLDSAKLI